MVKSRWGEDIIFLFRLLQIYYIYIFCMIRGENLSIHYTNFKVCCVQSNLQKGKSDREGIRERWLSETRWNSGALIVYLFLNLLKKKLQMLSLRTEWN